MQGSCLCEAVAFRLCAPLPDLYQCHCSLCRKSTGSASNTALILPIRQFKWLRGKKHIRQYQRDSGYRQAFCQCCGCSLPVATKKGDHMWVPAGLLGEIESRVVAHLYVDSKAAWDEIAQGARQYAQRPDLTSLAQALQNTDS